MLNPAAIERPAGVPARLSQVATVTLLLAALSQLAGGMPYVLAALLLGIGCGAALGLVIADRRAERDSRAFAAAVAQEERRRVVRDVHDGAQQRLVHTIVVLKLADRALDAGNGPAGALVGEALEQAQSALQEVRALAHGSPPAALRHGGLAAGVQALAERTPVPVSVDVPVGPLPSAVEAAAYFFFAEAFTNVAKHARARTVSAAAWVDAGVLRAELRDDGIGGADPRGSGLQGLSARIAELDGRLDVATSGNGTRLTAAIPLGP